MFIGVNEKRCKKKSYLCFLSGGIVHILEQDHHNDKDTHFYLTYDMGGNDTIVNDFFGRTFVRQIFPKQQHGHHKYRIIEYIQDRNGSKGSIDFFENMGLIQYK
jgi:hypothetical protein